MSPSDEASQQPDPIPQIYINAARISVNFQEVRLFCGEDLSAIPTEEDLKRDGPREIKARFVPRVVVVFPPEFMRSLATVLAKSTADFEKNYGKFRERPAASKKIEQTS